MAVRNSSKILNGYQDLRLVLARDMNIVYLEIVKYFYSKGLKADKVAISLTAEESRVV
jgi:hypothetical protein